MSTGKIVKVLLAETNKSLVRLVEDSLKFDTKIEIVSQANTMTEVLHHLRKGGIDVVIVVHRLARFSASSVIIEIMKKNPIPILLASITITELENDKAMDYGLVDTVDLVIGGNSFEILERLKSDSPYEDIDFSSFQIPALLQIKVSILSKLNIEKFRMQIDQINQSIDFTYTPSLRKDTMTKLKSISQKLSTQKLFNKGGANKSLKQFDTVIVLGASTGGPRLLNYIIGMFAPNFPPVLVVQHMPKGFVRQFAQRMDSNAQMKVNIAEEGDHLSSGQVYVAPGGIHMRIQFNGGNDYLIRLDDGPPINFVKPSLDVTLQSVANIFRGNVIAAVMTGMGQDGRDGCAVVKEKKGLVLTLAEQDSVIYGMNKSVVDAGLSDKKLGMDEFAPLIEDILRRRGEL